MLSNFLPWLFEHESIDYFVFRLRINNVASEKIAIRLGGEFQNPCSRIEELTVKTYYIYPSKQQFV